MPTGYTSKIYDGEQVTGKEFLMTCARAFGALIEMRDESLNAKIPEELEVNTYHKKELENAKQKLKSIKNMSIEEVQKLVDEDYQKTIKENKRYYDEQLANLTDEEKIDFVNDDLDSDEIFRSDIISVGGYDRDEVGIRPTEFIAQFPDEKIGDIKKIVARELNKKFGTKFKEKDISYFESGWYNG